MKAERGGHLSFLDTTVIYKVPDGSRSSLAIHLYQPLYELKSLQQGHIFHSGTWPDPCMSLSCLISISPSFHQQVVSRHDMLCVGLWPKISCYLCPEKDDPSIYCILCECGQFFTGLLRLQCSSTSGKAKHQKLQNTKSWYLDWNIKDAVEIIEFHPNNMKRVALSWAGNENLIHTKKESRTFPCQDVQCWTLWPVSEPLSSYHWRWLFVLNSLVIFLSHPWPA